MVAQHQNPFASPELTVHRAPAVNMVAMPQREAVPETPRNAGKTKADVIAEIQAEAMKAKEAALVSRARALRRNPNNTKLPSLEKLFSAIQNQAEAAISDINSVVDKGCAPHVLPARFANFQFKLPEGLNAEVHGDDHHKDEHETHFSHGHDGDKKKDDRASAGGSETIAGVIIGGQFFTAMQITALVAGGAITMAELSQMGGVVVPVSGIADPIVENTTQSVLFTPHDGQHKPGYWVEKCCPEKMAEFKNFVAKLEEERAKAAEQQHETQV